MTSETQALASFFAAISTGHFGLSDLKKHITDSQAIKPQEPDLWMSVNGAIQMQILDLSDSRALATDVKQTIFQKFIFERRELLNTIETAPIAVYKRMLVDWAKETAEFGLSSEFSDLQKTSDTSRGCR